MRVSTEDFVIACPFNGIELPKNVHLEKIYLVPDLKFAKTVLGLDKENEIFSNQHIQYMMQFCESYYDRFISTIELERPSKIATFASVENLVGMSTKGKFKSKFAKYDKHAPAHEIEDSIIFISRSELQEKYLTPKKRSPDDHQPHVNGETTNYSSKISLDSHSSSRAFSKYFSMQNLEHIKSHKAGGLGVSLNSIREGSHYSSNNEPVPLSQKSFVTEKLFNEFYHSTKQHSKYFVFRKFNKVSLQENPQENHVKDRGMALMHLTLPPPPKELPADISELAEDLPYYHVHDAIGGETADDVYAEICGAVPNAS